MDLTQQKPRNSQLPWECRSKPHIKSTKNHIKFPKTLIKHLKTTYPICKTETYKKNTEIPSNHRLQQLKSQFDLISTHKQQKQKPNQRNALQTRMNPRSNQISSKKTVPGSRKTAQNAAKQKERKWFTNHQSFVDGFLALISFDHCSKDRSPALSHSLLWVSFDKFVTVVWMAVK